jgi:hypothetical protein
VNAEQFNARYPVGTPVIAYPLTRPEDANPSFFKQLNTVTRTPAWTLGDGEPVVSVVGYAGGICLTHVDVAPRTNTPDRVETNDEGHKITHITLKRACNGCGQHLGDTDNRDVDDHGNLTDVRAECAHCRPLVEAEAAGCKTWELTPRSFGRVAGEIDRLRPWVFTKGYWQEVNGELQIVGLRVGQYPNHVVAFWGDWLIRRPDGTFTVHKAPAASSTTGAS